MGKMIDKYQRVNGWANLILDSASYDMISKNME
jgi:hypothetical protein